jgi:putative hydrolase of the HAD superfamily
MKVEAVLFDADGVLQHQNSTLHSLLTDVLSLPPEEVEARYLEVWEAESPVLTGQGNFAETMSELLVRWGRPGHADTFVQASKDIRTDEAIVNIVRRLRRDEIVCCLASNQMRYRARYMSESLGYSRLFDREFYSCDIGHKKPDAAYFLAILSALGLPPGRVLFIDDNEANVAAALDLGMNAAVFQPASGVEPGSLMRSILSRYGLEVDSQP